MRHRQVEIWVGIVAITTNLGGSSARANLGDIIAHWRLDEQSGRTAVDSSGYGYDGMVVSQHGQEPVWRSQGRFSGCLHFDLGMHGIEIPPSVFEQVDKGITVAMWIKGEPKAGHSCTTIFGAGAGHTGRPYVLSIRDCGARKSPGRMRIKFATSSGRDTVECRISKYSWSRQWNHFAFVKDAYGGFQGMYLNGELVAEKSDAVGSLTGVGVARIGMASDRFSDNFWGMMDNVRIYSRALTTDEVRLVYEANPRLEALVDTLTEARRMLAEGRVDRMVAYLEPKVARLTTAADLNAEKDSPQEQVQQMCFDLCCLLARAKEAAGCPAAEVDAAYELALAHGQPSATTSAPVLLWLLEKRNTEKFDQITHHLNAHNEDYLSGVAIEAGQMLSKRKPQTAMAFLKHNLEAYARWQADHPEDEVTAQDRLPLVHYHLARAMEAVGASKDDVADVYIRMLAAHSRFEYRNERTAALVWLFENDRVDEYKPAMEPFVQGREISEPLACAIRSLCSSYNEKRDWTGFEQFLDKLFAAVERPHRLAQFVDSCIGDGTSRWARGYREYLARRPALNLARSHALAEQCSTDEGYRETMELYQDMIDALQPGENRHELDFQLCRCAFLNGRYEEVISKLEHFITKEAAAGGTHVKEAMLMIGQAYIQLDDLDKAVKSFSAVLAQYPDDPAALEASLYMGYCSMLKGNFSVAEQKLTALIRQYPDRSCAKKARICLRLIGSVRG